MEALTQGACTSCGETDDNYSVRSREHIMPDDEGERDHARIVREVSCDCGESAVVEVNENGIETTGAISHEEASWNEESSDDEEDE